MTDSVHIYFLLHQYNPSIRIPITIVKGFGFKTPYLLKSSKFLTATPLTSTSALAELLYMFQAFQVLQKKDRSICFLTHLPVRFPEETVFQQYIEGTNFTAKWKYGKGYLTKSFPLSTKNQFDELKNILSSFLASKHSLRLVYIEAEFIIGNDENAYFIAVSNYSYTDMRERVASMQVLTKEPEDPQNYRTYSRVSSTPRFDINEKVGQYMKDYQSIKYIRFNQIKSSLERNEKMLKNEMFYGKKLAKISDKILVKSTKNVKELKRLNTLIRSSQASEASSPLKSPTKKVENFQIIIQKKAKKKTDFSSKTDEAVNKILSSACDLLDSLRKKT